MSITEPLIVDRILKYCHHSDWKVVKPFLISKQFHEVFNNFTFAKDYLINLFQLSEYQINLLSEAITYFSSQQSGSAETDNGCKKPKKKKRKTIKFEKYENVDQVYMGILKLYVKCNLKNQDSEVRRANKRLQKNFSNMLGEWKMDRFNFTADLNDMISNHKGIFMTEFEISSPGFYSYGGITQRSEFVLFTHCGFPLTFRNQYSTYLELDHCCCDVTEICGFRNICNKRFDRGGEEELFRHALSYSEHNGTQNMGTQFSERAFNGILMTLFHHAENYFGGYDSQEGFEQEKILGTMLYEILNCSLVASDNGKSFFAEKFQEEDDFEGLPFYSRNRY